jgi:hypothetical protein
MEHIKFVNSMLVYLYKEQYFSCKTHPVIHAVTCSGRTHKSNRDFHNDKMDSLNKSDSLSVVKAHLDIRSSARVQSALRYN